MPKHPSILKLQEAQASLSALDRILWRSEVVGAITYEVWITKANMVGGVVDQSNLCRFSMWEERTGRGEPYLVQVQALKRRKVIARAWLDWWGTTESFPKAHAIAVGRYHRHQGIGSQLYVQVEKHLGLTVMPSANQTRCGYGLWRQPNRPFGNPA